MLWLLVLVVCRLLSPLSQVLILRMSDAIVELGAMVAPQQKEALQVVADRRNDPAEEVVPAVEQRLIGMDEG